MPMLPSAGFFYTQDAVSSASLALHDPEDFINAYAYALSEMYVVPLAAQLEARPALLAQLRASRVISKLPVAALWLLVVTNAFYGLFAIALATLAILACGVTPVVPQVQTRLSVAGLAAQLFEPESSARAVGAESSLFKEKEAGVTDFKRIGVKRTDTNGSMFVVNTNEGKQDPHFDADVKVSAKALEVSTLED
jgi:hypothetical protein